jgi:hypothetical protein
MALIRAPLAHVFSGGGPLNTVLLLVGALVALGGNQLRLRGGGRRTVGRVVTVVGIGLFVLGLVVDAGPTPSSTQATVRFIRPRPGAEVPAGRPTDVSVDLQNAQIALSPSSTTAGHLHLYVDGQLQQMPYATDTTITLDPGRHSLTVEYVDPRHLPFNPRVRATIEVRAVS